jgi:hypothetical protein
MITFVADDVALRDDPDRLRQPVDHDEGADVVLDQETDGLLHGLLRVDGDDLAPLAGQEACDVHGFSPRGDVRAR